MQNQELKVYLSSLIQTIESNQKLDLIKEYVEQIIDLQESNGSTIIYGE